MYDRQPTYPGRVTLTPVPGQANTYDMVIADQPTNPGTPPTTENLLQNATGALFGLDASGTVNDAFAAAAQLISNAMDLANTKAKIVTGTYTGTGTYGQSNPTSLSFDFVPQILFIQKVNPSLGYGVKDGLVFLIKGSTSFFFYKNGGDYGSNTITQWGTTVSWYLTTSTNYQYDAATEQLNSGTYNYVAIG